MRVFIAYGSAVILEKLAGLIGGIDGVEIAGGALNAADAIESIAGTKPDLVILDINLDGGGSGAEVAARIKKGRPPPVVVALAAVLPYHRAARYRERCRTLGADYLFDKVTEIGKLYDSVRRWSAEPARLSRIKRRGRLRGEVES